jgi:hypothetical protein
MTCWIRNDEHIVGVFTPGQVRWMRRLLVDFRHGLQAAAAPRERERHAPPAIEYGRHVMAVVARRKDGGDQHVSESELLGRMLEDADTVLATLPRSGGVVVLRDERLAWPWIWSLYECCLYLTFTLGLDWEPLRPSRTHALGPEELELHDMTRWLFKVIDGLIDTAELPYPAISA